MNITPPSNIDELAAWLRIFSKEVKQKLDALEQSVTLLKKDDDTADTR
ncbi:MAG: hypothetical protein AAGE99_05900 [Chlamydiota bacterium]